MIICWFVFVEKPENQLIKKTAEEMFELLNFYIETSAWIDNKVSSVKTRVEDRLLSTVGIIFGIECQILLKLTIIFCKFYQMKLQCNWTLVVALFCRGILKELLKVDENQKGPHDHQYQDM